MQRSGKRSLVDYRSVGNPKILLNYANALPDAYCGAGKPRFPTMRLPPLWQKTSIAPAANPGGERSCNLGARPGVAPRDSGLDIGAAMKAIGKSARAAGFRKVKIEDCGGVYVSGKTVVLPAHCVDALCIYYRFSKEVSLRADLFAQYPHPHLFSSFGRAMDSFFSMLKAISYGGSRLGVEGMRWASLNGRSGVQLAAFAYGLCEHGLAFLLSEPEFRPGGLEREIYFYSIWRGEAEAFAAAARREIIHFYGWEGMLGPRKN